jgi:hypothetical protein
MVVKQGFMSISDCVRIAPLNVGMIGEAWSPSSPKAALAACPGLLGVSQVTDPDLKREARFVHGLESLGHTHLLPLLGSQVVLKHLPGLLSQRPSSEQILRRWWRLQRSESAAQDEQSM